MSNPANPVSSGKPQLVREPVYEEPLSPGDIRLTRHSTGRLQLHIRDERTYIQVRVARAFPLSEPDRYIGLLDGRDRSIGFLKGLEGLDDASQALIEEALQNRYFMPIITHIEKLKEEFGVVYCYVGTNHGAREFVVRGLRDNLEERGPGEFLITDTDGNRYRIPDVAQLDPHSRGQIELFI
jgi:hypothetical protein